ncbi:metallophosphatase family protein [Massilia sp. TS11]|uniref:metallophosphoesterase family protein n=1 Tax=Massilia sp. TS11 TaxID=2908003 RepID=UPI001EDA2BFF|nr:metallophosphatase family protein [Massilia sp. TS11]MCG2583844.1 metallophosphatase family protein [Massilia sp. TS11]
MTLRVAHFSDLHYATGTLAEVDRCFAWAVQAAVGEGLDLAIVSGDATDHALGVHAPAVDTLVRRVRQLADHCPVLMLQGTFSHEPPGTLNVFRHVRARWPVYVAERIEQVALLNGGRWLAEPDWDEAVPENARAVVTCLPTVNKATVAAHVGAGPAARAIGEQLAAVLAHFGHANEAFRALGVPTIGVAHGTVHGCVTEHGVPMAGFDHEFTSAALLAAGASAFMLGHIHKHQAWERAGRMVAYAGSIGRLHYGEEGEKGFLLWKVGVRGATCSLVPTPARRTVDIVFDGPPDLNQLAERAAQADVDGAYVRVRWQVAEEDRHAIDRAAIEHLLASAAECKLEGRIIGVQRARAPGMATETSVEAQLARWAGLVEADPEPLRVRLVALREAAPEAIAETILAESLPAASLPLAA